MNKKKYVIFFFIFLAIFLYFKFLKNNSTGVMLEKNNEIESISNIIKDVEFTTKDKDGNEYLIYAKEGEIDLTNSNVIFLKNVKALIKLIDTEEVRVDSDFGKYNSENYDTIFSKNVIINYIDNKITGEYLDLSLQRNSMIISKNVNYYNLENILKADVVEIDIKTKDTKIFMLEQDKKVNIKNKK